MRSEEKYMKALRPHRCSNGKPWPPPSNIAIKDLPAIIPSTGKHNYVICAEGLYENETILLTNIDLIEEIYRLRMELKNEK